MARVIIGMDPQKRSATIEIINSRELLKRWTADQTRMISIAGAGQRPVVILAGPPGNGEQTATFHCPA